MIEVRRRVDATPDAVWRVLANGWLYPSWVVGACRMRAVDTGWPEVGARLHFSAGVWPLLLNDSTRVLESDPPQRLVLQARGWPFGEARIILGVVPDGAGCEVSIAEDATHGLPRAIPEPLRQLVFGGRNTETLRRLAFLAEGREDPSSGGGTALGPLRRSKG